MSFPAVIHTGETVMVSEKGYAADGATEVYEDEDGNKYTRDSTDDPHKLTPLEQVEEDVEEVVADATEIVHDGGKLVADAIEAVSNGKLITTLDELAEAALNHGDTSAAKTVLAGIEADTIKEQPAAKSGQSEPTAPAPSGQSQTFASGPSEPKPTPSGPTNPATQTSAASWN